MKANEKKNGKWFSSLSAEKEQTPRRPCAAQECSSLRFIFFPSQRLVFRSPISFSDRTKRPVVHQEDYLFWAVAAFVPCFPCHRPRRFDPWTAAPVDYQRVSGTDPLLTHQTKKVTEFFKVFSIGPFFNDWHYNVEHVRRKMARHLAVWIVEK